MTVSTTINKEIGEGNGVATVFPFTFGTLPGEVVAGDLVVSLFDLAGLEIPQTEGADYTVTGEGSEDGGAVVFVVAPPNNYTVLVQRILPLTQPTDIKNQGSFYPKTIERQFADRLVYIAQQQQERIDASMQLPAIVENVSTVLPIPEVNTIFGWNEDGTAIKNFPLSTIATSIAYGDKVYSTFSGTGAQVSFTLTEDPGSLGNLDVSIDGVTQVPASDYTLSYKTVNFTSAPANGAVILVRYDKALPIGFNTASATAYTPPQTGILGSVQGFLDALWSTGSNAGAKLMRWVQTGTGAVARTVEDKLRELDVSIYEYGYVDGADATLAIQRAINALPARGGTIRLPASTINISGTIEIGDGDAGTNPSTKQGIRLVGSGSGLIAGASNPTMLNYTGALRTTALINVNGRIGDCSIENVLISCNANTGGIKMTAFGGCRVRNVKINNPATGSNGLGVIGGAAPTGNYNIFNEFDNVQITLFQPNCHGLYMDGVYGGGAMNDTWLSTFTRLRIETVGGATNAVCARFRFVDSISFYRCHLDSGPEPTSIGAVFDATGSDLYPGGIAFYDCSIKNTVVVEDGTHHIGVQYFYGFGTYDAEVIPTHANLRGITDDGRIFGDFLYNIEWLTYTPTVTLVGGAGNTVPQYTNNYGRYRQVGKTVHFSILLDGQTGADGAGTGVVNVALPVAVRNRTNVYAEIHGRVVKPGASYVGIGRILPGGTTMPIRFLNGTTLSDLTGADQGAGTRTIAITGSYECA